MTEKLTVLILLTLSYVFGELGHFLIGVTSRDLAREIGYGDLACFENITGKKGGVDNFTSCSDIKEEEK